MTLIHDENNFLSIFLYIIYLYFSLEFNSKLSNHLTRQSEHYTNATKISIRQHQIYIRRDIVFQCSKSQFQY